MEISELRGLLIGSKATGKTTFIRRLSRTKKSEYGLTMKSTDYNIELQIPKRDGSVVSVSVIISDTPGQRDFAYQSFSDGIKTDFIVMFYETNTLDTFNQLSIWLADIKNLGIIKNRKLPIFFVGNKIDLKDDRMISDQYIEAFLDSFKKRYNWDAPVQHYFISAIDSSTLDILTVLRRMFVITYKHMKAFNIQPTQEIYRLGGFT